MAEYNGYLKGATVGPTSKFYTCVEYRYVENGSTDTQLRIQCRVGIWVDSGNFNGNATCKCSWSNSSVKLGAAKKYYLLTGWGYIDKLVNYGSSFSVNYSSWYTGGSGTTYTSTCKGSISAPEWFTQAPYAPTGLTARRVNDSLIALSWSVNSTKLRPCENLELQMSKNGSEWVAVNTSIAGATRSMTVSVTPNAYYQFRIIAKNVRRVGSTKGSTQYSAWSNTTATIYTTPNAPTISKNKATSGKTVVLNISSSSPVTQKFHVQYRKYNASQGAEVGWIDAGDAPYQNTAVFTHNNAPGGQLQYRAKAVGYSGLNSGYTTLGEVIITAQTPLSPTSVSASNTYDNSLHSSDVKVSIKAPGSSAEYPRQSFIVYAHDVDIENGMQIANGVQVSTIANSSTSTVDISQAVNRDLNGKCQRFGVVSSGSEGSSAEVLAPTYIYGKANKPIISVFKDAYITKVRIEDGNSYPSIANIFCFNDQGLDKQILGASFTDGVFEFLLEDEEWALNEFSVTAYCGPDESLCPDIDEEVFDQYSSEITEVVVQKSPSRPQNVSAERENSRSMSKVLVRWNAANPEPTRYRIEKVVGEETSVLGEVEANGQQRYLFEANINEHEEITIQVVSVLDYDDYSYESAPTGVKYHYVADPLVPPTLKSIEEIDSGVFEIKFEPSEGGYPIDSKVVENTGYTDYEYAYRYMVYVNDEPIKMQEPDSSELVFTRRDRIGVIYEESMLISVDYPGIITIRMVAIDEFNTSRFSNPLIVKQEIVGVSTFVYDCTSIEVNDCIIENMSLPLKIGRDSFLSIQNSKIVLPEGSASYYDIDKSSSIFEVYNEYK